MKKLVENRRLMGALGGIALLGLVLIMIDRAFFTGMLLGPVGIFGAVILFFLGIVCFFIAVILVMNWIFGGWRQR